MARWKLQEPFLDFCGYSASDQFQKVAPNNIISITHLLPAVPYLVPTEKLHNIPKYPILSLFHIFFINLQFFLSLYFLYLQGDNLPSLLRSRYRYSRTGLTSGAESVGNRVKHRLQPKKIPAPAKKKPAPAMPG